MAKIMYISAEDYIAFKRYDSYVCFSQCCPLSRDKQSELPTSLAVVVRERGTLKPGLFHAY